MFCPTSFLFEPWFPSGGRDESSRLITCEDWDLPGWRLSKELTRRGKVLPMGPHE
jgi:hypothetical protein